MVEDAEQEMGFAYRWLARFRLDNLPNSPLPPLHTWEGMLDAEVLYHTGTFDTARPMQYRSQSFGPCGSAHAPCGNMVRLI